MAIRLVCISRAIAAGGETIGQEVARRLGYRYVDDEIIAWAAREARVDPAVVAAAEHRQPLLQSILAKLPSSFDIAGIGMGAPINSGAPHGYRAEPEDLRILIRAAVQEIGQTGEAVIVAHAASMALAGVSGVLRVWVTASPATRGKRLALERGVSEREASTAVAESDRERRDYFKRFYKIEEELPTHYDLTINTDTVSPEDAAKVIVAIASPAAARG